MMNCDCKSFINGDNFLRSRNDSYFEVVTPPAGSKDVDVPLPVVVLFPGYNISSPQWRFTYKPNPNITGIRPQATIPE